MKKLILLLLLISASRVNSQTFTAGTIYPGYYDINPDTLINYYFPYSDETYNINMFGDAAADIVLTAHGAASSGGSDSYIKVQSLNPDVFVSFGRLDSVLCPVTLNWFVTKVAKPLDFGDTINTGTTMWDDTVLFLTDHTGHSGCNKNVNDWLGGDRYLGVKYQNGSTVGYGWIKVNCMTVDSCYIYEYSYSSVVASLAQNSNEEKVTIYPNPSSGIFKVSSESKTPITSICVSDVLGNCVWRKAVGPGSTIDIDLSGQSKGIYFMEIITGDERVERKIIRN